jgi:hypothetical protein
MSRKTILVFANNFFDESKTSSNSCEVLEAGEEKRSRGAMI